MKLVVKNIILFFFITSMISCSNTKSTKEVDTNTINKTYQSIHDFSMESIEGKNISLADYKGKVLVIVNTASKCGLTPQYKEIEAFYKKYQSKGVEVLGFPANNFLSQEPGDNGQIAQFCEQNYGVTFQMFSKISVKGKDIDPLYSYLTNKSQNGAIDAPVSWNFQKFIIDKQGKVVAFFPPKTTVNDAEFIKEIESLI